MEEIASRINFNSIKVRLKRYISYYIQDVHTKFQFHKGTIKTT